MSQLEIKHLYDEELTTTSTSPRFQVGTFYQSPKTVSGQSEVAGAIYQYIKYDAGSGSVACALGKPVGLYVESDGTPVASPYTVTCDISDSNAASFKGIAMAAIADGSYGWICISGQCEAYLDNTGAVDEGHALYWSGDGELDVATIGSHHVIGHAVEAVASGDGTAKLATIILLGRAA